MSATTPATPVAQAECYEPIPIENPAIASAVESVPLRSDSSVTTVRESTDSDYPGEFAVAIDICSPTITNADGLRPIATDYAKALRASPVADQIFAVYVASYQVEGNEIVNDHKIKVGD